MAKCGWCKTENLKMNQNTGFLETHIVRGTKLQECKGQSTYNNMGRDRKK